METSPVRYPHMGKLAPALATLAELANLRDDKAAIDKFLESHYLYFENLERDCVVGSQPIDEHVLKVRGEIRDLWRGGERANEIAQKYLITQLFSDAATGLLSLHRSEVSDLVRVDWKRGELRLSFSAPNDFRSSIYELLKVSRLAKVCARPECASPYFIAQDSRMRYCSTDCADAMQDEWRREWWKTKGKAWLKQRQAKGKPKRKGAKR